jgi:hypothetical protein
MPIGTLHEHNRVPGAAKRAVGGTANALAAAVLFGLSAPVAKVLLARTGPLLLAGLLYLGAGFGLLIGDEGQRGPECGAPRTQDGHASHGVGTAARFAGGDGGDAGK